MRCLLQKIYSPTMFRMSVVLLVMCSGAVFTAHAQDPLKPWNKFADSLAAMHKQRMKLIDHTTSESVGGYGGMKADPAFYTEVKYFERSTGRLLAQVKTENRRPKLLHVIEVYFYDDKGRPLREYTAAYLPDRRTIPVQTLIDIYTYNEDLQALRQFDASDDLIYEQCLGKFEGKTVRIAWDDLDMPDKIEKYGDADFQKSYKACFGNLKMSAGPYLDPMYELKK